jgi:hypothetical protein
MPQFVPKRRWQLPAVVFRRTLMGMSASDGATCTQLCYVCRKLGQPKELLSRQLTCQCADTVGTAYYNVLVFIYTGYMFRLRRCYQASNALSQMLNNAQCQPFCYEQETVCRSNTSPAT